MLTRGDAGTQLRARVVVKGTPDEKRVILDTRIIERIVNQEIIVKLDKKNLNEIISNPTMERISVWIWNKLKPSSRNCTRSEYGRTERRELA